MRVFRNAFWEDCQASLDIRKAPRTCRESLPNPGQSVQQSDQTFTLSSHQIIEL
jgi:hypothetical protein